MSIRAAQDGVSCTSAWGTLDESDSRVDVACLFDGLDLRVIGVDLQETEVRLRDGESVRNPPAARSADEGSHSPRRILLNSRMMV
jgi:hypothetical protein